MAQTGPSVFLWNWSKSPRKLNISGIDACKSCCCLLIGQKKGKIEKFYIALTLFNCQIFHTWLTMYISRPFQYDCTSRCPYELVLVALWSVVVYLRCVLVMERFWLCSGLSTRTVIWGMKQHKMLRFHRYFVLSFWRIEICYVRLLSRIVVTYHIFSLNPE